MKVQVQEANKSEKDTQGVVISSTLSLSRDHLKKKKKEVKSKNQRTDERQCQGSEPSFQPSRTLLPCRRRAVRRQCVSCPAKAGWPLAARRHPVAALVGAPLESGRSLHSCSCSEAHQGCFGLDGVRGDDRLARAAYPMLLFSILFSLSFSAVPYNYSNEEKKKKGKKNMTTSYF